MPANLSYLSLDAESPPPSNWTLGSNVIEAVLNHPHLGILRSVHGSMARTNLQLSKGCSSFFALNRYGSRFGCLHPIIALKLYSTFSLPRLLYGAELWDLTKTELNMFEHLHRKMLRTTFRFRTKHSSAGDASCKLCRTAPEDVTHFLTVCQRLEPTRSSLIFSLPSYVESSADFVDTIPGISWVDVDEVQQFCILFISGLRQARSELLTVISS